MLTSYVIYAYLALRGVWKRWLSLWERVPIKTCSSPSRITLENFKTFRNLIRKLGAHKQPHLWVCNLEGQINSKGSSHAARLYEQIFEDYKVLSFLNVYISSTSRFVQSRTWTFDYQKQFWAKLKGGGGGYWATTSLLSSFWRGFNDEDRIESVLWL